MTVEVRKKTVVPGDQIFKFDSDVIVGKGVHVYNGIIHSTLLGYLSVEEKDGKKHVNVYPKTSAHNPSNTRLPVQGDVVTCKVTSVNPRLVKVNILSVAGCKLSQTFRAVVKKEDIRDKGKDTVIVYKCYRPGDLILARVISIGDLASYFLSTAENELGVVFATSPAGVGMVPVSWCEMKCPKTNAIEFRKVAKVIAK